MIMETNGITIKEQLTLKIQEAKKLGIKFTLVPLNSGSKGRETLRVWKGVKNGRARTRKDKGY